MPKSTAERVKDLVIEQLGVTASLVTPDANFLDDLGADSLDVVELSMAVEEEFGLEISDEEGEKLKTVGDLIKYLEEHAPPSA